MLLEGRSVRLQDHPVDQRRSGGERSVRGEAPTSSQPAPKEGSVTMRIWQWLQELIHRLSGGSVSRLHVVEAVMTICVIGMSFVVIALMLARFTGTADEKPRRQLAQLPADNMTAGEVRLGEFTFMFLPRTRFASGMTSERLHVLQFDASALIRDRDETSQVEDVFEKYRNRVRATIDAVTRGATDDELRDPELDSVRRRIRTRVNTLLGDEVIDEVVFSDFRYYHL